jgi:hypothetical protein
MPHRWALIDYDDPNDTEVCIECGAQKDKNGPIEGRASITGGWRAEPIDAEEHEEPLRAED